MLRGVAAISRPGAASPQAIARLSEELGFDLLVFPDHSHIPDGPRSLRASGPPVGRDYIDMYDCLLASALALAATERLRVGPGVAVLSQRDPIHFAKQIASLRSLFGDRLLVGVGAGWNCRELHNHGVEYRRRFELLDAKLELVRGLVEERFDLCAAMRVGPAVTRVHDVFGPPAPRMSRPHFLVGGSSEKILAVVARHEVDWMPNGQNAIELAREIRAIRAGERPPIKPDIGIVAFAVPADAAAVSELADAGASGVIFRLDGSENSSGALERTMRSLDDLTRVAA